MVEISKQAIEDAIEAAGMEGWDHIEDRMRAALTAAAPYMSGVKVKQLEWEPIIRGGKDQQAKCSLGKYVISVNSFQTGSTHYIWVAGQSDDEEHKYECETMAEAKAAAQADYEKRFWAMAEVTAVEPYSAREQALDDDMRMGINDLLHNLRLRLEAPEATIETDRKLVGQIIEMVDAIKSQPTYDASEPIETAPKDGTEILAWREDCGWFIASYTSLDAFPMAQSELDELDEETLFKKDWFTQDGQFRLEGNEVPIRWQPVPPAPQTGGEE